MILWAEDEAYFGGTQAIHLRHTQIIVSEAYRIPHRWNSIQAFSNITANSRRQYFTVRFSKTFYDITDGHQAIDERDMPSSFNGIALNVKFVLHFPDQFFQDVFHRRYACHPAILIHDNRHLLLGFLHLIQHTIYPGCLWEK